MAGEYYTICSLCGYKIYAGAGTHVCPVNWPAPPEPTTTRFASPDTQRVALRRLARTNFIAPFIVPARYADYLADQFAKAREACQLDQFRMEHGRAREHVIAELDNPEEPGELRITVTVERVA